MKSGTGARASGERERGWGVSETKDEVVKNLERRLVNAKKVISELRAEVEELRQNDQPESDDQSTEQQRQSTDRRPTVGWRELFFTITGSWVLDLKSLLFVELGICLVY